MSVYMYTYLFMFIHVCMYVCMYDDVQVQAMEASESFTWAAAVKQYEEEFKRIGAYMHK